MAKPILTRKERLNLFGAYYSCQAVDITKMEFYEYLCRAQAKKIFKWGNELCPHYDASQEIIRVSPKLKRHCSVCWQELEKI